MNSLQDLNNASIVEVEYTDQRDPDIVFDGPAENTTYEAVGLTFSVPTTYEIIEVINYETVAASISFDVSEIPGTTVSWASTPTGATITESSGVWTINEINSVADWNKVKSPTITLPAGYNGDEFDLTVTLNYTNTSGAQSRSYVIAVNAVVANLTAVVSRNFVAAKTVSVSIPMGALFTPTAEANVIPTDLWVAGTSATFNYSPGVATQLTTSAPQLTALAPTSLIYTVEVSTDRPEALASFTMQGGGAAVGFTYNPTTKKATFSGSRSNINIYIQYLIPNVNVSPTRYYWDFDLSFKLTNNETAQVEYYTLPCFSSVTTYLSQDTPDTYTLNTATTIQGSPEVDPGNLVATGTWTVTIDPYEAAQVASLTGEVVTGFGVPSATRITHSDNPSQYGTIGARVRISNDGTYIFTSGGDAHRVYHRSGSIWTQQARFFEDDFIQYWDATVATMSRDGTRVAWLGRTGSAINTPVEYQLHIYVRSSSTWNLEQTIVNPTPAVYTQRLYDVRLNSDGTKLSFATADGFIRIYTRAGSTWSLTSSITNTLSKTIGTAGTLRWDIKSFDMSPDGNYYAIGATINTTTSDPPPALSHPDYAAYVSNYNDVVRIYSGTTLQKDIVMTTAVDGLDGVTGTDPITLAFNTDATVLAIGNNSGFIAPTRASTTWSNFTPIIDSTQAPNSVAINGAGDRIIAGATQLQAGSPNTYRPFIDVYYKTAGVWVNQIATTNTSYTTSTSNGASGVAMTLSGENFAYGNPAYTVSSVTRGEVNYYNTVDFGRFETATKQLTIRGDKATVNSLVEDYTMTPATGEADPIDLIYTATDPNGVVSTRNHRINKV